MKKYKASSLEKYIAHIKEICEGNGRFLFRGQLEGDKLTPGFFRKNPGIKPEDEIEKDMLDDFKRRGRPFLTLEPQSEYEWLALARHHGMPTRLLDWTSNALAALWFTVNDNRINRNNGAIWVLNFEKEEVKKPYEEESPFDITKTEIIRPKHIEKRFVAQGGWFTIHLGDTALSEEKNFKQKLRLIEVPRRWFINIKFSLNICGINKVSLFPELGGLCEHISWQHSKKYIKMRDKKIKSRQKIKKLIS